MTIEEIINIVHKTIYQFFDVCGDNEEVPMSNKDKMLLGVNKAICNNIKALEQEPCEDAVDRKAVLSMAKSYNTDGWNAYTPLVVDVEDIEDLPSVTPTRKTGKWTSGNPICPCCGEDKFKDLDADIWADWQPKFCPNCGAEMESEE